MDLTTLARHFRSFGRNVAAESPLYGQLGALVSESPDLLALAAGSPEQTPMVFLAAVHDELLRDPAHALAAYYPTLGGDGPGPGLAEAFTAFCADRAAALAATLSFRRTQTNEVGALRVPAAGVRGGRRRAPARADRDRGERGAESALGPLRL